MTEPEPAGSAIARRQLGRTLTRLREAKGLRQEDLAGKLEWSQAKLWRLESGKNGVTVRTMDIEALARFTDADEDTTEHLVTLLAQTKVKGWWYDSTAIPGWFQLYLELEALAFSLREYHTELITGVLQTRDYASAVVRADAEGLLITETEVRELVDVRARRAGLLTRQRPTAPRFDIVLNEAAVRRPVGGEEVMAAQLRHLVKLIDDLPNLTVRIIPFSAGIHRGALASGSFVVLDFPPDSEPTTVYSEGLTGAAYLNKPAEVERHVWAFEGITNKALDRKSSRELLTQIAKEFET
ncbi:helix-turn-helix domain-containing protein [Fodinicola feengrottensis]|uniref:Helix-turn-helix transcriptional regulator n=1 Tax=Fodinicola feengrottensis TaxID=435914 RepID=A0ABN2GLB3_9ACTN|nr:helix-turn-helix transcriptional regulator [Fodinicola feengrottensis]